MKRLLLLLLLPAFVHAAPVSFQLNEIRLVDLVRLVYSEVLGKSYVLDSEFLANQDLVSLHLRGVEAADIERRLAALLDARGMSIVQGGGVAVIGKRREADEVKEVLVYRPSFRSVPYLLDLVQSLFPQGAFSGQRGISPLAVSAAVGGQPPQQHAQQTGSRQQPQAVQGADSGTSAFSRIDKADQDAIVFHGTAKDSKRLVDLLGQLDKPAGELLVKAVVYEVRSEQKDGNALKLAGSILSGKLGFSIDTGELSQNVVKVSVGGFDAIYSALASDSRFKLVSSPTMRVKSGGAARFVAGADVPVLGNVSYPNNGQAVQSVEYKASGVILDIKPTVREQVTDLTIGQQISSFVQTNTGVNSSPTLLKRELQTQIVARDGEIIVLGGLEEHQDTNDASGLSFLPSFLRANGNSRQRTEILVVLDARRI